MQARARIFTPGAHTAVAVAWHTPGATAGSRVRACARPGAHVPRQTHDSDAALLVRRHLAGLEESGQGHAFIDNLRPGERAVVAWRSPRWRGRCESLGDTARHAQCLVGWTRSRPRHHVAGRCRERRMLARSAIAGPAMRNGTSVGHAASTTW